MTKAGLFPVPHKLVFRIQAGEYVDMAKLLPDRLGINAGPSLKRGKKDKRPELNKFPAFWNGSSALVSTWLYMRKRIQTISKICYINCEARIEYEREGWLSYDKYFHQNAATTTDTC